MSSTSTPAYYRRAGALALFAAVMGLLLAIPLARADEPAALPIETVVDRLVADALAANLELAVAGATVGERLAALDAARASYLPVLDLTARYTRADGGRVIEFPVGDLLNPVYATLNQLTGSNRFPPLRNQQINFQRSREQDTRLSLTQPLYDGRLGPARAAAAANYDAANASRSALAGRIERDMRDAYYRWLEARARVAILEAAVELARENHRVNDSLFKNGKITRDLVYRAEADQLEIEQSQLAAANSERLAASYVNLLRNSAFTRALPLSAVVDADVERVAGALAARTGASALAFEPLTDGALRHRPELRALDAQLDSASAGERLARAQFRPRLALAVDAGTQGETFALSGADRYVLASVVLKFNLFSGGSDQAGVRGARAQQSAARSGRSLAEQQIRLEVQQALQDFQVAAASLGTAAKRVESASGAFRIAARKRDLGQINQAEFVDARRVLTDAELNQNVTRFTALGSLADLEYALGAGQTAAPSDTLP